MLFRGRHGVKLSTLGTRGGEPTSCTKTCLRGGHVADHEGSNVSSWVGGLWTLQDRLVVSASSMVEVLMGHSPYGLLCSKGACKHDLWGGVVLLRMRKHQP